MSTVDREPVLLPQEQQAIRDKCFHPTGTIVEFRKEEVEQSVSDRFEEQVRKYPNRLAVKTRTDELTYDALNMAANRVANAILAQSGDEQETVALILDHGIPEIVATMACLKAGKIFFADRPVSAWRQDNFHAGRFPSESYRY